MLHQIVRAHIVPHRAVVLRVIRWAHVDDLHGDGLAPRDRRPGVEGAPVEAPVAGDPVARRRAAVGGHVTVGPLVAPHVGGAAAVLRRHRVRRVPGGAGPLADVCGEVACRGAPDGGSGRGYAEGGFYCVVMMMMRLDGV